MSRIRQARRRVRDALVAAGLAAIGLAAMPGLAPAQERPYAPSMSCAALKATVDDATQRERFARVGAKPVWTTAADATARAARERPMWRETIEKSGASAD